jgi:signal peptidase I
MKKSHRPLIIALSVVAVVLIGLIIFSITQIKEFTVTGQSMSPTLISGQKIETTKLTSAIKRYNVVVIKEKNSDIFSRVIGLPGDRVVIKSGAVIIYNKSNPKGFNPDIGQSYFKRSERTLGKVSQTLSSNQYYVLGDNRSNASDSRNFGPISKPSIIAIELRVESK